MQKLSVDEAYRELSSNRDEVTWLQALGDAAGNEEYARALYIKYRTASQHKPLFDVDAIDVEAVDEQDGSGIEGKAKDKRFDFATVLLVLGHVLLGLAVLDILKQDDSFILQRVNEFRSSAPERFVPQGAAVADRFMGQWHACLYGQQWNGVRCTGHPQPLNWFELQRVMRNSSLSVPTAFELATLVDCEPGRRAPIDFSAIDERDGRCIGIHHRPAIREQFRHLPSGWYWSAESVGGQAWGVDLDTGKTALRNKNQRGYVIFLRR